MLFVNREDQGIRRGDLTLPRNFNDYIVSEDGQERYKKAKHRHTLDLSMPHKGDTLEGVLRDPEAYGEIHQATAWQLGSYAGNIQAYAQNTFFNRLDMQRPRNLHRTVKSFHEQTADELRFTNLFVDDHLIRRGVKDVIDETVESFPYPSERDNLRVHLEHLADTIYLPRMTQQAYQTYLF